MIRKIALLSAVLCLAMTVGQQAFAKKYPLGDIPLDKEKYKKHQKVWPREMAEFLPLSYDARVENLVTPAKNQGACGSCWAFASVGAMESHMLKAYQVGPKDLSEQQQVSCNTAMWGCDGGSANAIRYWEYRGPLEESFFPYTANDSTACMETEGAQLGYRVIDWHTVAATASDFKSSIYTYGPSYWRYDVHNDFYDYWNYGSPGDVYVNNTNSFVGGHAVLLIGWDDSKGAFLCKNSWGEYGGPNGDGTFWIAYSGHATNLNIGMVNFSLTSMACSSDAECDDGIFCNGAETCVNEACVEGTPVTCADDSIFCNGAEICNEATQSCGSQGDPCADNESCDENLGQCITMCGNGICDLGENCSTCPNDCISGASGGSCGACFKGQCDGVCHPVKENAECADCWSSYCCGDGVCEGEEDSINCAIDCPVTVCGDGTCDAGENQCLCPADCGAPGNEICGNGIDDNCNGLADCDDDACSALPACLCQAKNETCQIDSECCSGHCKNGRCR